MTSQANHFQFSSRKSGKSGSNESLHRSMSRRKSSSRPSDSRTFRSIETEAMRLEESPKYYNKSARSPPPSYEETFADQECDLRVNLESPTRHSSSRRRRMSSTTCSRSSRGIIISFDKDVASSEKPDRAHHRRSSGHSSCLSAPEPFVVNSRIPVIPDLYTINDYDCLCLPIITEEQARTLMRDYEKSKFKLKRGVADKCLITEVVPRVVFRYTLKTLFEKRRVEEASVPYKGETVDSPDMGSQPSIWNIPVKTPKKFVDKTTRIRIPHTSYVCECDTCLGTGCKRCSDCKGFGRTYCSLCMGCGSDPYSTKHPCPRCSGLCYMRCDQCHGNGSIPCPICTGRKSLLCFKQLVVEWISRVDRHLDRVIGEKWDFLYGVKGECVFGEEARSLSPVTRANVENEEIRNASKKYIESHNVNGREKVWQKHAVSVIAINTVHYEYKGTVEEVHFVGKDRQICAEKYPKKFPWNLRCC